MAASDERPGPSLEPLLTVSEVAAFARVSEGTIYNMVETCTIPHLRIGAQIRFDRQVLIAFMESGQ